MAIINMDLLEYKYQLILTSLSEVPLGELYGVYGLSYSPSLSQTGELSFTVPKYFEDNGVRKPNVTYEDVNEDRLVLIDNQDYYYIDSCKETNENGIWKKEVHAFRREYELNSKRFGAYEPETERFLFFIHPSEGAAAYPWTTIPTENRLHEFLTSSVDVDGYRWGIFNEIERLTTWRLERDNNGKPIIPASLRTEVRMLSFSEENILEVLNKIQEVWNILFEYDTINRIIKIKTQEMFEDTPNGVLSDESFITTLSREIKGSEIKTRLFLYNLNGDGVTAERMAHGQPYIEDYSYYINNGYLTPHLVSALNAYTTTLNTLQTQTFSKWTQLKSYYEEYKRTQTKIDEWEQELIGPLSTYDYYETIKKGFIIDKGLPTEQVIAEPRPLTPEEKASQDAAKRQITALERNIGLYTTGTVSTSPRSLSQLDKLIKTKKSELAALKNTSLMSNVFANYESTNSLASGSLMKEMEPFIRDAVYQSDSIEDSDDLYTEGLKILSQISKPRIQFEMALVDFLSMVEFDHAWSLATLGQILRIESKDTGFIDNIILLRYTHNPDEKTLTFEFSNDLKINNNTTFLAELISKSNTTASQVSFNANYWAQGGSTGSSGPDGNIFDNLYANYIQTNKLVAGEIEAERINTTELIANAISAEEIRAESLYAKTAEIDSLIADSIVSGSLTTEQLDARYAEIDLANITVANIDQAKINSLAARIVVAAQIRVEDLNARYATIDFANVDFASIDQAEIESLSARVINSEAITTRYLTANEIDAKFATIENLTASYITAAQIAASYADINLANIGTGVIQTLLSEDLLASSGYVDNLKVGEANIVSVNAGTISAGTLSAERILITGSDPNNPNSKPLLLTLNNLGDLVSENVDTLDGYILTNNTVNASKITAETITTREIAAGSVSADRLVANSITAAQLKAGEIEAIHLKTGTITSASGVIGDLSANNIKAGTIMGSSGKFYMDIDTGHFNLGNRFISDENGVRVVLSSGQTYEDYIEGKMTHNIYAMPTQQSIQTDSDGVLRENSQLKMDVSIFEGLNAVSGTISGVELKDGNGVKIVDAGVVYGPHINPTSALSGEIKISIAKTVLLPTDSGTIEFLITIGGGSNIKVYKYKTGWAKAKAGTEPYTVTIFSTNGNMFKNGVTQTELYAKVYKGSLEVTDQLDSSKFKWTRVSNNEVSDIAWANNHLAGSKTIMVTEEDVFERATFNCTILE